MAGMDEALARLTNNPSFLDWLRGNAEKRGVPSWKDTTAGRSGGFPGREPGMPLAQGNSPSAGRLGGTYSPSGNMPVPPSGSVPVVGGGSGVGGPPASLSGALGSAAKTPWTGLGGLAAPAYGIARQPDVGIPQRHLRSDLSGVIDKLMGRNGVQAQLPQSSNGGSLMPMPPASAAPIQAQPIPNATGNMPAQLVKDQSRIPAQPSWAGMAQTPINVPPTPGGVPLPVARPQQTVQPVPLPRSRPQIPLPTPRPQVPVARTPAPASSQAAQNQSILDTLL